MADQDSKERRLSPETGATLRTRGFFSVNFDIFLFFFLLLGISSQSDLGIAVVFRPHVDRRVKKKPQSGLLLFVLETIGAKVVSIKP